jgi:hypothetical protein
MTGNLRTAGLYTVKADGAYHKPLVFKGLNPSGNCMFHLLQKPLTLHFLFMAFV